MIVRLAFIEVPFVVAIIVVVVVAITAVVFTVKVADLAPAATFTLTGTVADELLLDSEIVRPPGGAADNSVTVAMLDLPPFTEVGLRVSDFKVGASMARFAVPELLP